MQTGSAVALMLGGHASEHAISLRSGRAMALGLLERAHPVHPVVLSTTGVASLLAPWTLASDAVLPGSMVRGPVPDARCVGGLLDLAAELRRLGIRDVVLALHGPLGEDGRLQGFLETAGFRYTGSGVAASAVCADKALTKRVLSSRGLATPAWSEVSRGDPLARVQEGLPGPFPLVVKPKSLGSSVGVTIVRSIDGLPAALEAALADDPQALIETFIPGRELTCAVIPGVGGPRALPLIEIVPRKAAWFDYASKYDMAGADEIVPAPVDPAWAERVTAAATIAHRALGCQGITRTDFLVDQSGAPWLLEVNTTPGMTEMSLVPKAARAAGLTMADLTEALLEDARVR